MSGLHHRVGWRETTPTKEARWAPEPRRATLSGRGAVLLVIVLLPLLYLAVVAMGGR